MNVEIREATFQQKPLLERLMRSYLKYFAGLAGEDLDRNAIFEYKYIDFYWTDASRHPFLIVVDDQIAGFALVNTHTYLCNEGEARTIAEFFIVEKYRGKGIGKAAAFSLFDRFPGKWEIRQTSANVAGQRFWRRVIGEYTAGNFTETMLDDARWRGPVQCFDNSQKEGIPSESS